jgi:hypothetical protein
VAARQWCYTDSRRKFLAQRLLHALLSCAASGSGLYGSMIPGSTAYEAVQESVPPLVWWRTGARAGIIAAENFANVSAAPNGGPPA